MIYNHVENFCNKSLKFPITETLNQITATKKAQIISTFHFSTLYTRIHEKGFLQHYYNRHLKVVRKNVSMNEL